MRACSLHNHMGDTDRCLWPLLHAIGVAAIVLNAGRDAVGMITIGSLVNAFLTKNRLELFSAALFHGTSPDVKRGIAPNRPLL